MITSADSAYYKRILGWSSWAEALFYLPSGVFLVFAILQFVIASRFGDLLDKDIFDLLALWLNGPKPNANYSGLELSAVIRLERAFMFVIVSIALMPFSAVSQFRRDRRLARQLATKYEI